MYHVPLYTDQYTEKTPGALFLVYVALRGGDEGSDQVRQYKKVYGPAVPEKVCTPRATSHSWERGGWEKL